MTYLEEIIYKLMEKNVKTVAELRVVVSEVYKSHKIKGYHTNITLRDTYVSMVEEGLIEQSEQLEKLLITKRMRSLSGVSIITVLTKPYDCPGKCIYCPTQQDVPKSYLSDEPAVMRAILNDYDPRKQVETRMDSLVKQGHPVGKIELIIIGGTFNYLPRDYQEEFVKSCFDALNGKVSKNLDEAKKLNEKAASRCVGLTLETRPDFITAEEVTWFRYLGATRVELGVQSVYDDVLKLNARGHDVAQTKLATKLLKNAGFKICYHLMPNLYGSNLDKDKKMFEEIFTDLDFCPDYIKIYPCMVIKDTGLYRLWKEGKYNSYTDEELIDLVKYIKKIVPCWIRIMRTIRDIPAVNIVSGSVMSNLRQVVLELIKKEGWRCKCIRCREVGQVSGCKGHDTELIIDEYSASEGKELFLSIESEDRNVLYSLLRLRLPAASNDTVKYIPELTDCALIREVHTYGQEIEVGRMGRTQHVGYGRRLVVEAENLARKNGYSKIAVISGVGVREYYRKFGYRLIGEYMIKELTTN